MGLPPRAAVGLIPCVALLVACGSNPQIVEEPYEPGPLQQIDLYDYVDPFIGTGGIGFGVGSTYPGPAVPFAMIHPGPDTRSPGGASEPTHCSGYYYDDPLIGGFSLARMNGTGVPDYGVIALMPVDGMGSAKRDESGYATAFEHDDELAEPGYYSVRLEGGIEVEITTTLRASLLRITFPTDVDPVVLVDLEHTLSGQISDAQASVDAAVGALNVRVHNDGGLSGRYGGFDAYAAMETDVMPEEMGVWDEDGLRPAETDATGIDVGAWWRWPAGTQTVHLRVGLSFVDAVGAAANLAEEIPHFDFDQVRQDAEQGWRDALSSLELQLYGDVERDATIMATALYHVLLMPTLMSDVDGRAVDVHGSVITEMEDRYSDFSLWDTYRTLHPWLLLAEHPLNGLFASSLVRMAEEGGAVPLWTLAHGDAHCMIGSPGEIVLAESALKGVSFEDEEAAFDLALVAALGPAPGPTGGRSGIEDYLTYGYVAADHHSGSVSRTQEYAIADSALANWARRLGRDSDAAMLEEHAGTWRNLWDPDSGFFRGKDSSGDWVSWPGPEWTDSMYTEGNAWHYLWLVPHDPEGLAEILGGPAAARARLAGFFEQSRVEEPILGTRKYYWHSNEPDLVAPWLFAAWGDPGASAAWVRWIVDELHTTGPDGLAGNDDGGTMSAWLLFAAAGLYPVAGSDRYMVAAPRFPRVVLHRDGGDLRIEAEPDPRVFPVVASVSLDDVPLSGPTVTHAELAGARVLRFAMARP